MLLQSLSISCDLSASLPSIIYLLVRSLPVARAQIYLLIPPTGLPGCAQTCPLLVQAQTGCVPPAAPVTDQSNYLSCFCQSGYLSGLRSGTANVCAPQCTDAEFAAIAAWYKTDCGLGGRPNPNADPTTTTTAQPADTATVAPAGAVTNAANSLNSSSSDPNWMATHYRWIIMIVVLIIGFILLAVIGSLLHKRYKRRAEAAQNPGPTQDFGVWGPNQHSAHNVQDFGVGADTEKRSETVSGNGKGKEKELEAGTAEVAKDDSSRKLKKQPWIM